MQADDSATTVELVISNEAYAYVCNGPHEYPWTLWLVDTRSPEGPCGAHTKERSLAPGATPRVTRRRLAASMKVPLLFDYVYYLCDVHVLLLMV